MVVLVVGITDLVYNSSACSLYCTRSNGFLKKIIPVIEISDVILWHLPSGPCLLS